MSAGRSRDRYGQPMTIKLKGKVEPYVEAESRKPDGDGDAVRGIRGRRAARRSAQLLRRPAGAERERRRTQPAPGKRGTPRPLARPWRRFCGRPPSCRRLLRNLAQHRVFLF